MTGKDKPNRRPVRDPLSALAAMPLWSRLKHPATFPFSTPRSPRKRSPLPELLLNLPKVPYSDRALFSLRISLNGTDPVVWRRVHLRSMSLEKLHQVIQIVMGWQDTHLHRFKFGGVRVPSCEESAEVDERTVAVSQILGAGYMQIEYQYDYDANWHHTIVIEKCWTDDSSGTIPECVDGENDSPRDDIGGLNQWTLLRELSEQSPGGKRKVTKLIRERLGGSEISTPFCRDTINHRLRSEIK